VRKGVVRRSPAAVRYAIFNREDRALRGQSSSAHKRGHAGTEPKAGEGGRMGGEKPSEKERIIRKYRYVLTRSKTEKRITKEDLYRELQRRYFSSAPRGVSFYKKRDRERKGNL